MPNEQKLDVARILYLSFQNDEIWKRKITRGKKKGEDVPEVPKGEEYKGCFYYSSHERISTCEYKGYNLNVAESVDLFKFPIDVEREHKNDILVQRITAIVKKNEKKIYITSSSSVDNLIGSLKQRLDDANVDYTQDKPN